MGQFRWLAAGPVPAAFDLRRLGWRLIDSNDTTRCGAPPNPLLVLPAGLPLARWLSLAAAPGAALDWTVMLGIDDPLERARLLRMGFGDALGWGVSLEELETRVRRMIDRAQAVPRCRHVGPLRLDLLRRDAMVAGLSLGLHPREFALLWRLADAPGLPVSASALIGDVWRMAFRPETNSLAVHVSRLRAKLRLAGLDGVIETLPDGSYRLTCGLSQFRQALPRAAAADNLPLDAYLRLGEERSEQQQLDPDPCAMK